MEKNTDIKAIAFAGRNPGVICSPTQFTLLRELGYDVKPYENTKSDDDLQYNEICGLPVKSENLDERQQTD